MQLIEKKKPYFGGPAYSARKLIQDLSNHPDIVAVTETYPPESSKIGFSKDPVTEYLKEIVATPSIRTVQGLRRSLRLLWYKIFNGLEIQGVEPLKNLANDSQIIYLPCHRSHLDYLLLSYVLDEEYLSVPHIIAGNNLNLKGVGKILKGGGAVFIRRTFRNNPLYATCFITYLNYLLDNHYPIEVFIEGGRSRTGKNLPPKIGILTILIEYLLNHMDKDMFLVPVSFTYERIPEENSYINELNGAEKQKENLLELINAYKVIKKNFGKVFVSFAPPMSLRGMIEKYTSDKNMKAAPDPESPGFKTMAYSFGMDVMDQINIYTRTSALPVVATALLSEKHRGFHKKDLARKSQFLVDVYQAVHPRAQDTLIESEGGLDGIIDFMIQGGSVQRIEDPEEDIYFFKNEDKIRLNLYKNIFAHHFVIPSIISLKIIHGINHRDALLEQIHFFDNLLRYEFMFPRSYNFTEAIDTMINFAVERDLIIKDGEILSVNQEQIKLLELLANIIQPFLDSFYVAIKVMSSKKISFPVEQKSLLRAFRDSHQKYLLLGKVSSLEGNLTVTYKNIIKFFTEERIIEARHQRDKKIFYSAGDNFDRLSDLYARIFPKDNAERP